MVETSIGFYAYLLAIKEAVKEVSKVCCLYHGSWGSTKRKKGMALDGQPIVSVTRKDSESGNIIKYLQCQDSD